MPTAAWSSGRWTFGASAAAPSPKSPPNSPPQSHRTSRGGNVKPPSSSSSALKNQSPSSARGPLNRRATPPTLPPTPQGSPSPSAPSRQVLLPSTIRRHDSTGSGGDAGHSPSQARKQITPVGSPNRDSRHKANPSSPHRPAVPRPKAAANSGSGAALASSTASPRDGRRSSQLRMISVVGLQPSEACSEMSCDSPRSPVSPNGRAPFSPARRASGELKPGRDNYKVCVRVRPLSAAESKDGERETVQCAGESSDQLTLSAPAGDRGEKPRHDGGDSGSAAYAFDWVLSSTASQRLVYDLLGERVMRGVADGFHGCVFAYGQTGSGKSHTIFGGRNEDRGLLPRITEGLFEELQAQGSEYIVKLSYLEIYNEKLRDLLRPSGAKTAPPLEVRQHPQVGVFVEGLTGNVVHSADDCARLLDFGHKIRVVGRTNMNAASSRSHAVVTLHVNLNIAQPGSNARRVRRAEFHAVDLAGSERMKNVGDSEVRQKESKQINRSLWALSLTISKLSSASEAGANTAHIPYRNSKLTYLLSDALMGNCRTVMLACVSPASSCYTLTESTVRFAQSAKKVCTRPVKNEECDGDLVAKLRDEIEILRQQLLEACGDVKKDLNEKISTTLFVQRELTRDWKEQEAQSLAFDNERQHTLQALGLGRKTLAACWMRGDTVMDLVRTDADPYFVNVCDDPLLSGCLTYTVPRGEVIRVGSNPSCTVHLEGLGVQPEMCHLICPDGRSVEVYLPKDDVEEFASTSLQKCRRSTIGSAASCSEQTESSLGGRRLSSLETSAARPRRGSLFKSGVAQVFVNSELLRKSPRVLRHGDRLRIGRAHVFQLFVPQDQGNESTESMADIIDEMTGGYNSGEQILLKEYAMHLKERIGHERAMKVFRGLQELQPLIEEANDLTAELRGGESHDLTFKAHVLTDVMCADEDPELLVAIRAFERPDWIGSNGQACYHYDRTPSSTLRAVWSTQKFQNRLEVMRDLYQEVSERDAPWGLPPDLDPWKDDSGCRTIGASRSGSSVAWVPKLNKAQDGEVTVASSSKSVQHQRSSHSSSSSGLPRKRSGQLDVHGDLDGMEPEVFSFMGSPYASEGSGHSRLHRRSLGDLGATLGAALQEPDEEPNDTSPRTPPTDVDLDRVTAQRDALLARIPSVERELQRARNELRRMDSIIANATSNAASSDMGASSRAAATNGMSCVGGCGGFNFTGAADSSNASSATTLGNDGDAVRQKEFQAALVALFKKAASEDLKVSALPTATRDAPSTATASSSQEQDHGLANEDKKTIFGAIQWTAPPAAAERNGSIASSTTTTVGGDVIRATDVGAASSTSDPDSSVTWDGQSPRLEVRAHERAAPRVRADGSSARSSASSAPRSPVASARAVMPSAEPPHRETSSTATGSSLRQPRVVAVPLPDADTVCPPRERASALRLSSNVPSPRLLQRELFERQPSER